MPRKYAAGWSRWSCYTIFQVKTITDELFVSNHYFSVEERFLEDLLRSIVVWRHGLRAYYDVWSTSLENGDDRTFEELLPFFTRFKKWTAPSASTPALFEVNSARKQALAGVYGSGGHVQINYNSFLTDLDVPVAHAVVAAAGIVPNANPDDGTDLFMPAQVVARTVDPNTGLRSYSASVYFDANARARDNLHVVTNAVVSKIFSLMDGGRKPWYFRATGKLMRLQ